MGTPIEGLRRLREAAQSSELDAFCERHDVRIVTVFGSAARGEPTPRDLDIGVMFEPGTDVDYLAVIGDLTALAGTDIDLVHLNRGGVR